MTPTQAVVHGTLKPDGTLELDERPALPPGPVEITLRPLGVSTAGQEDWWQYLQRARAELEAAGHHFRTKEEIDAEIDDLRSGDDRIERAYREAGEEQGDRPP
jgi:hypothetical protein